MQNSIATDIQLPGFPYIIRYDMNGDGGLAREELHHCLKGCFYAGYGVEADELEECERDIVEIGAVVIYLLKYYQLANFFYNYNLFSIQLYHFYSHEIIRWVIEKLLL